MCTTVVQHKPSHLKCPYTISVCLAYEFTVNRASIHMFGPLLYDQTENCTQCFHTRFGLTSATIAHSGSLYGPMSIVMVLSERRQSFSSSRVLLTESARCLAIYSIPTNRASIGCDWATALGLESTECRHCTIHRLVIRLTASGLALAVRASIALSLTTTHTFSRVQILSLHIYSFFVYTKQAVAVL